MKKLLLLLLLCLPAFIKAQSSIHPENLRCEYLVNPEGIDEPLPRLSWTLAAINVHAFAQRQTAYRVLVSSSAEILNAGKGDMWDSGWVKSDEMQHVVYGGNPLVSDKLYCWKVCVNDELGKTSGWSSAAHWSTGLYNHAEWSAAWIGTGDVNDPTQVDCTIADPWLRKTFDLTVKPAKAMMFVASIGYHELYVNGKKIGEDVLSPCVSDNTKRARYVAYDISRELKPGKNVVSLWLGASWSIYASYHTDDKPLAPIVTAQADLYNAVGDKQPAMRIKTDDTWKTHPSPNKLLEQWKFLNMGGELWDASKEIPDWNLASCDETTWKQAVVYHPRLTLSAQMVEPNRLYHEIHPIAIEQRVDGTFRVDMGINFSGWTEIKLKGQPGQRIDIKFSEREKEDMTFRIHSAYILGASGEGTFKNRFNYSSGRWITISGLKDKPALTDIKGWVVRTAYDNAATFACSDSLQNWIYDKVRWNFENLSLGGYVVDCPQRERMGYGGDSHATSESGLYTYQLGAFYTKWMEDWRDVQGTRSMDATNYGGNADYGILPHTAPTYWGGGGPGWGGIVISLPWLLYQQQGDTRVLEKNFDLIKNWLAFLNSHAQNNMLVRFGGDWDFLGDWLWPNAGVEGMNNGKPQNICFNNCYWVYNLRTAAKIARQIGRKEEALQWEKQAAITSMAIQAAYYHEDDHSYADSSMGDLAAALLAEVPPPALRDLVIKRLENEILVVRKGHIHVGITGGAMLFKLLRSLGRDDLIYSMTSQTDYPGWGYMKANGATSLWEMWEKDLPGHSLLHSSYLYPGAWYIDGVAGIRRDPDVQGFKKFAIHPPKLTEQQMTWAKASYDSPAGLIKSAWERKNGSLYLSVTVPPGTTATAYFPAPNIAGVKVSSAYAKYIGSKNGYLEYHLPAGEYTLSGKEMHQ
ncbi:family 78 glycoside hydrolase catalytic domain [Mucilaginibacter flavidus]|uniref:family 78 glycoside hydrolase catalytic domain n=1 Tax=Mucilaginibacter flavidus TaxID=2949309 RepID=UPI0020939D40|nr:family 78 glycoside hydrolase catalytic domain [Mucilaginibacter flavidus]MCO5947034.1 glycoside hydrolase family 78 protein [Mucilaginibacter flavidus]